MVNPLAAGALSPASPHAWRLHACLVGMALLWGLSWPSGRALVGEMPPLTISAWRFTVAAAVLLAWLRMSRGAWPMLSGRQLAGLALTGAVGVFGYAVFFMYALQRVEAGRAAVVVTTNPVFVTLGAAWLFGEPFNRRIAFGLALAVLGAATVMTHGTPWTLLSGGVGLGELLLLGCIATWVGYSLMGKRLMAGIDALVATTVTAVFGGVLLWVAALAVEGAAVLPSAVASHSPAALLNLLFLALGPTVLAYAWFYRGIEVLGAGVASSYISLVPVFGVAGAVLWLGESTDASLLVGGALALAGVVIANRARAALAASPRPPSPSPSVNSSVSRSSHAVE
jgi:drug/metabolite transporter (DMT)-like permease